MAYTDIDKPNDYFNTVLYTGTGSGGSNREITGVGFQPDFTWVKTRGSSQEHVLSDSVRGATKALDSQATTEEETTSTRIGAFISDGFQLGSGSIQNRVNQSGIGIASWNWLASNTTASNTDGSITSTVSANTTSGFSIVSFDLTGQTGVKTVGHGLGTAPKVVITKRRSGGAGDWTSYFGAIGNSYLVLNSTAAGATNADFMNNTAPTSSVFTVGDPTWWAQSPFIAYCFAEKKGFSKFGSYVGNGSTDGTFVYTGFKPAFVIIKRSSSTSNWVMFDNKRDIDNVCHNTVYANLANAETTADGKDIDMLSNGFKLRSNTTETNGSGSTYIYMAFAENPFVTSTSIPTTAR